jgi:hypothetical protein
MRNTVTIDKVGRLVLPNAFVTNCACKRAMRFLWRLSQTPSPCAHYVRNPLSERKSECGSIREGVSANRVADLVDRVRESVFENRSGRGEGKNLFCVRKSDVGAQADHT